MLALESYGQACGFSVLTTDELFYINGGSRYSGNQTSVSAPKGGCSCDPCNCGDTYITIYGIGNQAIAGDGNSNISNNVSSGGSGGSGGGGK